MVNCFESKGAFENRVYFSPDTENGIKSNVSDDKGKELYGAGCRSYGKITGFFLSIFGIAVKLDVGGKSVYINNNSFAKLIIRLSELGDEDRKTSKTAAKKMQDLYLEHKKIPYKNVKKVKSDFKRIVRNREIEDFGQMILRLNQIAKS